MRPAADGIHIYADAARSFAPLAVPAVPRCEVADELIAAVRHGRPPLHCGRWGRATLEACLGIIVSARTQKAVHMTGHGAT